MIICSMTMYRLIIFVIIVVASITQLDGQVEEWQDSYRSYTINVDLKSDEILFDYELYFISEDKKGSYRTASLDTFVLLLKNDIANFPTGKENILFYIHGMFGGQVLNYKSTLVDFRLRYIDPPASDMSRIVGYRWPGNSLDYPKCRDNAHAIAEAMNENFREILNHITAESPSTSVNVIAHSLGSELWKEMMVYENTYASDNINLNQVVICAPDLDENAFHEGTPLSLAKARCKGLTVYHSNKDFTLTMSKNFNNRNRLGLDGPDEATAFGSNLSFVETSKIADEENFAWKMTGHSYVRASERCSGDILSVFTGLQASELAHRLPQADKLGCYILEPAADQ